MYQQIPHAVEQLMSSERMPILSGAISSFELFMTRWENIIQDHPSLEKYIKPSLDWAYLYYGHMDSTRAHIISMHKYILSYIVRLTIICSSQSYNTHDMDPTTMGSGVYCNGRSKDSSNGKFIYIVIALLIYLAQDA